MVKQQKKHSRKKHSSKGFKANFAEARRINASTGYDTCTEQLSPFGGLLAMIKFFDLLKFKEIFDSTYQAPSRKPKMGHYLMVVGILMLLFIGFMRDKNHMKYLSECTILIVDDSELNIDILVEALGNDYDVSVAMDGESALDSVSDDLPDLILLDIMMPGIDGYTVCERLKESEETKNIPVIFLTAMTEEKDETRGLELGAIDYITKPINPSIVRARVKNNLELKIAREGLLKQNEILRENARLRDDVERITRHDLKNPLTAVIGMPDMIRLEGNLNGGQDKYLDIIQESGYLMLNMINLSLDLFKMERGAYQFNPRKVDILFVLRKIFVNLQAMAQSKGVECQIMIFGKPAIQSDSYYIIGEDLLCYSLFANLIKNAVEASPKGEVVTVFIDESPDAVIRVHNEGVVPSEIREKFFEKYVTSGKTNGTGLGTYSAKLITETQGGSIKLQSSPEEGTTIAVCLKKAPEKNEEGNFRHINAVNSEQFSEHQDPNLETVPPVRVLVVDDDEYNRILLERYLAHPNISIKAVENGEKALINFYEDNFDVIILDMEMPGKDGLSVAAEIRRWEKEQTENRKQSWIFAFTAHDDDKTRQKCFDAGCNVFLIKPITKETLIEMVLSVVSGNEKENRITQVNQHMDRKNPHLVILDAELKELIPGFLSKKKQDIESIYSAIKNKDFRTIQKICHRLKGSFHMYEFLQASRLCHQIEEAAIARELDTMDKTLNLLTDCLDTVKITYYNDEK